MRRSPLSTQTTRERAVAHLRSLVAADLLGLDEFERQLAQVLDARTESDLSQVLAPLPSLIQRLEPPQHLPPLVIENGMNAAKVTGDWKVPSDVEIRGGMGSLRIDFCEARFDARVTNLTINGGMGSITVIVPEELPVEFAYVPSSVGIRIRVVDPLPGLPYLHATINRGMGSVTFRPPSRLARWRGSRKTGALTRRSTGLD